MDQATKTYLQKHLATVEAEKVTIETQQQQELADVRVKVESFSKQLIDGINAKYGGLLERKRIEVENTRRMLNNEDPTNL